MNYLVVLFLILVILLIIIMYVKDKRESFSPTMSADQTDGSSALYGWDLPTSSPISFSTQAHSRVCCSCDNS